METTVFKIGSETSNHLHEIDFLISTGDKICPVEVKSGNYRNHKSLDNFCTKYWYFLKIAMGYRKKVHGYVPS